MSVVAPKKKTNRKRGRSRKGCRAKIQINFTRKFKFSLLLFMNYKGPIQYQIKYGGFNTKSWNYFIFNRLSSHINPYPLPNSIIIIDNLNFHHDCYFETFIKRKNAIIIFLPEYHPHLNLAEYAFNAIRASETSLDVKGEIGSFLSLQQQIKKLKTVDWIPLLRKLGY